MAHDRRAAAGLTFDPDLGVLLVGAAATTVGLDATNRQVLNAYVEVTARARGDRVANLVEVRQEDVDALARALDLDADDLAAEVERVLGATRAEAQRLVARLRDSRVIGGIAKAATGALVAGALTAGCAAGSAESTTTEARAAVTTEVTTTEATTTTTTEPEPPVVLAPPVSIDREP